MWINPRLRDQIETKPAPAETGLRLATFPRNQGAEELRLSRDEYQGRPYLALRLWQRGEDGGWYPTRKGVSVRMSEVAGLAEALARAAAGRGPGEDEESGGPS